MPSVCTTKGVCSNVEMLNWSVKYPNKAVTDIFNKVFRIQFIYFMYWLMPALKVCGKLVPTGSHGQRNNNHACINLLPYSYTGS